MECPKLHLATVQACEYLVGMLHGSAWVHSAWGPGCGNQSANVHLSSHAPAACQYVMKGYAANGSDREGSELSTANTRASIAGPISEALGDTYDQACEGSAFYALQSCINHSCDPNAHAMKGPEDEDGCAVVLAKRDIAAGEEVTISYIDEALSFEERQAALRDYGFQCRCSRCAAYLERKAAQAAG